MAEEIDTTLIDKALREYARQIGRNLLTQMVSSIPTEEELLNAEVKMGLQHPLRADPDSMKVFYIHKTDDESEVQESEIKVVKDHSYLEKLKQDVLASKLLIEATDDNPRDIINEKALEELIKNASKHNCPPDRAKRAAQLANTVQPNFTPFKDAGEMFLQQVAYNPIVELFCAFSTAYCADKKVACAHAVFCHEGNTKNVQYSASCLPDAALQLTKEFYLIAMMELKISSSGAPYQRDYYRCKLMTAMSLLAILNFLVDECENDRTDLDIAIPFIQGDYEIVELYVMRLEGNDAIPKIHLISSCKFWDSPGDSKKVHLISQLAVILARIVGITIDYLSDMKSYFKNNYNYNAGALQRNALQDPSSKRTSRSTNTGSSKRSASGKRNMNASTNDSPSDNENAAKVAASRSGLIQGLVYPFSRIRELDMCENKHTDWRRAADFKFFQQESPFFFRGIDTGKQRSQDNAVFCKVWREGDRHTSRKNVVEEIQFYRKANANDVPSPLVIDRLTALDVKFMTRLDRVTASIYHVFVTQYHQNDVVDETDIVVFALSLVQAVQKLHSIGILHCDIKPGNLLWDAKQKQVLLIDFEHAQEEVNARWYTATRKYEAPEISSGNPHTQKSDAYSVGKTLESVIKEFNNPVSSNIAALVASLIIESDTNRMTLVEAERQLRGVVSTNGNRSCLTTKRNREELLCAYRWLEGVDNDQF